MLIWSGLFPGLVSGDSAGVSHHARSLQPGEVVYLVVSLPERANEVKAKAFEREFIFYPSTSDQSEVWEGLVGIDLNARPGNHQIQILGFRNGTRVFQTTHQLEVLPKEFPVRRITVKEKYATPPQSELERIRRESKKVSSIFAKTTPERLWQGTFLRPVPGKANSSFGKRSIVNGKPRSPHSGTDFRAGEGTPVKAPNSGRVVLVQDLFFAGNTVILNHGLGLYSYFAHLSKFDVSEGDLVEKGDVVGEVGSTGRVTGPHLHWTLRLAGARVDPLSLMAVLQTISANPQ
jgi:murein DD-endopeptidase MepM/ murein hydrolase activator NlpD